MIRKTISKIKGLVFLFGISVSSLLNAPYAFADIPSPTDSPYISRCRPYPGSDCTPNIIWDKLFLTIIYFLVGTLIIELPIFLLFGFRTKKKIGLAILANIISVPVYHIANALLTGSNVLVAELLITLFECIFLVTFLRKEMGTGKIIIATIVANIASFILGTILINFIPFFYH